MGVLQYRSQDNLKPEFPFKIFCYDNVNMRQTLHAHEYVQIAYVRRGVLRHELGGRTLTVGRGDLFIIPPGLEHGLNAMEGRTFELIMMDFMPMPLMLGESYGLSGTKVEQPSLDRLQPWLRIAKEKQPLVEQLLQDIQDEFEHKEEGYELSIRLSLAKLMLLAGREARRAAGAADGEAGRERTAVAGNRFAERGKRADDSEPIGRAIRFIHDNYSQELPLALAARVAGLAPAYFSQQFKRVTGQTYVEYVNELRIDRAMELIRRNVGTMTEIALQTGFQQSSHFVRTFKKITGLTPTAYRHVQLSGM